MKKLLLIVAFSAIAKLTNAQATHVVISEVYGGGGNAGATYTNDFIELYNPTNSAVSLTGWSVQYQTAGAITAWSVTNLTGSIPAHGYFLIQEDAGTGGTTALPSPDATGTMAMSATAGKVALLNSTTALTGASPSTANIIDLVGFGSTANFFEGSAPTSAPSNTASVERKATTSSTATTLGPGGIEQAQGNGYDTDNNSSDFVVQANENPQNSASSTETLPVSLTSFTGRETSYGSELSWSTASEQNNSHFEILRSEDGQSFTKVGQVQGSNNSSATKLYSFTDKSAFMGINYYQLKQVDFDGQSKTYGPIAVKSGLEPSADLKAFASGNSLEVSLTSTNTKAVNVAAYDLGGHQLARTNTQLNRGYNSISLPVLLEKGVYLLRVVGSGLTLQTKFIKQ
ncbi:MAG: hypothetical protein K0S09_1774 [Sphingobacteriaceae bacterium]|jgi:hypothetical protein|nr:hypothetical protein [Sphingobacteriaceae bacterium]